MTPASKTQLRYVARGCCAACGKPRGGNGTSTYCRPCADRHCAHERKEIKRKQAQGICRKSGCHAPVEEGMGRCLKHLVESSRYWRVYKHSKPYKARILRQRIALWEKKGKTEKVKQLQEQLNQL